MSEDEQKQRIILVDGSAIIKSCFEGYKDPRSASYKGRSIDTAALFGYMVRTKKIYENFDFDEIIHIIDPPGGSNYRYGIYPEYKGTRKPSNPVLVAQEHMLQETLAAFGERCIRMRGVESDDVIATLAEMYKKQGKEVLIISPDKDLFQLVENDAVYVSRYVNDPATGRKTWALYGEEEVVKEFDVTPDQVADFLAIIGDSADNIPGINGIGPKNASKLLNQYGTLSNIVSHAHEVKGKMGEYLRECKDIELWAKLTHTLRNVENVIVPPIPTPTPEVVQEACDWMLWPQDYPVNFAQEIHGKGLPFNPNPEPRKKDDNEIDRLLAEAEQMELEAPEIDPFSTIEEPFRETPHYPLESELALEQESSTQQQEAAPLVSEVETKTETVAKPEFEDVLNTEKPKPTISSNRPATFRLGRK